MLEIVRTSEEAARPRIDELKGVIREFTKLTDESKPLLAELELEGRESGFLEEEEEEEEDSLLDDGKPAMTVDLEKKVRERDLAAIIRDTRTYQDQVDLHLHDLVRDLNIVTKTFNRILGRAAAGGKQSKKGARNDGGVNASGTDISSR